LDLLERKWFLGLTVFSPSAIFIGQKGLVEFL
jgi:hypothetical protein